MNSTPQQNVPESTEQVANNTNFPSNANSSLSAGSSATTNNGRLRLNFDLNLTTEELSSQVVEMIPIPNPYFHGDPHLAASRISTFSTLPSDDGGLLRRRRETEQNAEAFHRNTRMRTEDGGPGFAFPSLGRNLFQNSQFGIGTSSNPRWTLSETAFSGPSITNESLPLPPTQQVSRARYVLRALSTETQSQHPASSQPSSMFFNQVPQHYPRPVPLYSSRTLQPQFDNGSSLNFGRCLGLMQHLINSVLDRNVVHRNPPPQVENIIANTLMPAIINPSPRGDVVSPPLLHQVDIADQGPGDGFLPQVDYTNFVMYRDNGFETDDEFEGSEHEHDLDVDDYTWNEEVVDFDEYLENEQGELAPLEDMDNGLTEETIMQYLPSSNYVRRTIDSNEEDGACCICQDNYNEGDKLGRLRCCHCYHFHCIKQWLLIKNNCPICKIIGLDV